MLRRIFVTGLVVIAIAQAGILWWNFERLFAPKPSAPAAAPQAAAAKAEEPAAAETAKAAASKTESRPAVLVPDQNAINAEVMLYEADQFFTSVNNPLIEYELLTTDIQRIGVERQRFGDKMFVEGNGIELFRYWSDHRRERTPGFTNEQWQNMKEHFRLTALAFQRGTAEDKDWTKLNQIYAFTKQNPITVYRVMLHKLGGLPRPAVPAPPVPNPPPPPAPAREN